MGAGVGVVALVGAGFPASAVNVNVTPTMVDTSSDAGEPGFLPPLVGASTTAKVWDPATASGTTIVVLNPPAGATRTIGIPAAAPSQVTWRRAFAGSEAPMICTLEPGAP
jgi:hypothetical protein